MGTGFLGQSSTLAGTLNGLADCVPAQRLVGILSREQPFSRSLFTPISAQEFQQPGGELDVAVFVTLALLDANHQPLAVDVGSAQMEGFIDAHTGTVHRAEDHAVSKRGSRFEKPEDLFRAEDHGQVMFGLRSGNHFDGAILLQRDDVEKPEGTGRYRPAAVRQSSLLGQVDLVVADFFRAQLLG